MQEGYPVSLCCKVLGLSRSGYYAWEKRPAQLITNNTLMLYREAKRLFKESRYSLGSRELMKAFELLLILGAEFVLLLNYLSKYLSRYPSLMVELPTEAVMVSTPLPPVIVTFFQVQQ